MKYLKLLLIFFVFISVYCPAQESKSSLVLSGALAHYERADKFVNVTGYYKYPVDPGLELLYQYQLSSTFFLSTGLNYQLGRVANWEGPVNRFRFGEMSIPIIGKLKFSSYNKTNLVATMGFFYGKMVYVDWESPAKGNEWANVDKKYNEHYSNDDSFADVLLGAGISSPIFHKNEFTIIPYLKYRVNDNWMNYARHNISYGIKISYQLNLKGNEKM